MECLQETNLEACACTYATCHRRAMCCQCIQHHLKARELPGCCFPPEAERTYDRSFEHFVRLVKQGAI